MRKDTRLELKRKLEDKMFCKKKKKEDLISIRDYTFYHRYYASNTKLKRGEKKGKKLLATCDSKISLITLVLLTVLYERAPTVVKLSRTNALKNRLISLYL